MSESSQSLIRSIQLCSRFFGLARKDIGLTYKHAVNQHPSRLISIQIILMLYVMPARFTNVDTTAQHAHLGIAARVSANGTLARRELDALVVFLRLLFSASSDEAALVSRFLASRSALESRPAAATMASVLEVLPSLSCAWLIPDRVRRFSADIPAGPVTVRLQLDLVKALEDERNEAPEAIILRDMPWFVLSSAVEAHAERPAPEEPLFKISAGRGTENIMCALSLEDAARALGFKASLDDKTPLRDSRSRRTAYGEDITQPGAAAFLTVTGGTDSSRTAACAQLLIKAADILERRLDIARASAAEGIRIENELLQAIEQNR